MAESLWTTTCAMEKREKLSDNFLEVESVVIGAGMAGILIAYMLQEKGIETVVVEADSIGSGTTGFTTAKITSQHDLIYDRLISGNGEEKARQYASANQRAIDYFRQLIKAGNIDCDLEDKAAYLYTTKDDGMTKLQDEAEAAAKLGLPAALFTGDQLVPANEGLPVKMKAALQFPGQAQFHPLKFLKGISRDLKIYENTRIIDVQEEGEAGSRSGKSILITESGKISARHVIFACHYPFLILPGYYFARMYQDRTYIIAFSNAPQINGMYLDIDQPGWSFRNYKDLLLVVGSSHRTGENDKGGNYKTIRDQAGKWFPQAQEHYAWSTQDCMPLDGIPYIGNYASDKPNWYVATGFQKWGMTSSMVAADIISSMITKKPFEIASDGIEVFSPQRFTVPVSAKELWDDVKTIGGGLLREIFSIPEEEAAAIRKGHGGVVDYEGEKLGVYRDQDNALHTVSTKCSHMGCQLAWNPEEKSWDCPCHGSRFDIGGNVISGPAIKPPGSIKNFS